MPISLPLTWKVQTPLIDPQKLGPLVHCWHLHATPRINVASISYKCSFHISILCAIIKYNNKSGREIAQEIIATLAWRYAT